MIITISGVPGSGKSTIAGMLSKKLDMPRYSIGDLRGKMAEERKMTIDELNKLGETQAFTDNDVDEYQKELGKKEDNFIIDGRLSWYFIPNSYKIFINVNENEAARRIFSASNQGLRPDEPSYTTHEDAKKAIQTRLQSDLKRYNQYYGVDYLKPSNFDLIIDSSNLTPEEIIQQILEKLPKSAT